MIGICPQAITQHMKKIITLRNMQKDTAKGTVRKDVIEFGGVLVVP